jgi:hypothetical protein
MLGRPRGVDVGVGVGVDPGLEGTGEALPELGVAGLLPLELPLGELLLELEPVQAVSRPEPDTSRPEPSSSTPRRLSCGLLAGDPLLGDAVDVEDALY